MKPTLRSLAALVAAAAFAGAAVPVVAQVASPPRIPAGAPVAQVTVRYGDALASMLDRYGRREVGELAEELQGKVALAAGKGGFTRADLVLEDARPSRPTFEQQNRLIGLSMSSRALGGAVITGVLYRADGSSAPLTFSWFEQDLQLQLAPTTFSDAERAFDFLSHDLARGRVSTRLGPGGAPSRYNCRGSFDVWCTGI